MDIYAGLKISNSNILLKLRDKDRFHLCLYRSVSPQLQIFCHDFFPPGCQQQFKPVWRFEFKFLNLTVQSLFMSKYHPLHLYSTIPAVSKNDMQRRQLVQRAL